MMKRVRRLVRNLVGRRSKVIQVDEELRAHADLLIDEQVSRGVGADEARRRVMADLGSLPALRESVRDVHAGAWVEQTWRDVTHAVRLLRRAPVFAAVALLSLALGIGANAAIFQMIDAVMLRTLPVERPDELVDLRLADRDGTRGSFNTWREALTYPIWQEVQRHSEPFDGLFAWGTEQYNMTAGGDVRYARVLRLTGDAFRVLGVGAEVGRVFTAEEDRPGCGATGVVISSGFWNREFGRDPDVTARSVTLAETTFPIIGVTPSSFTGLAVGETFDVAIPLCAESYLKPGNTRSLGGTIWWLSVSGRLKPGWTHDRANDYLRTASPALFQAALPAGYPAVSVPKFLAFTLRAEPFASGVSSLRDDYSTPLMLLLGIAGLVLLTACGNIANLLLAQATAREREVAVRLALGASRFRLVRQSLIYSLVLSCAGAALGLVVAEGLSRFLLSMLDASGDQVALALDLDWRVIAFATILAVVTTMLVGLAPALRMRHARPGQALAAASRGNTAGHGHVRLRFALVVAQVALSLVLVVSALLFTRTLRNLSDHDAGFEKRGLVVANLGFGATRLDAEQIAGLRRDILSGLRGTSGLDRTAFGLFVPLFGGYRTNGVWPDAHSESRTTVRMGWVGERYFETLGVPLLGGREFDARDHAGSVPVAIVNREFVRLVLKGANPVGQRVVVEATPTMPEMVHEIVGVVGDAVYRDLREEVPPAMFTSLAQIPPNSPGPLVLMRSTLPAPEVIAAARRTILAANPLISTSFFVYADEVADSMVRERLMATLSGFFGTVAALLAVTGLYGVISYTVVLRERELGLRLALGATRRHVIALVLKQGSLLLVAGLTIGGGLALAATRSASSLLYGITASEPVTYAVAAGLLALVMVVAAVVPAIRAARLDPAQTLRAD